MIIKKRHQLYRYYQAFDLLILDEPDAFPFRGNTVLHGIAKTAAKGAMVYLTATPDASLLKQVRRKELVCLTLNRRPHGHDLPVPVLFTGPFVLLFLKLLVWLKQRDAPRMVFAPTIREARILHRILSWFLPCRLCTSKSVNRDEVIDAFRKDAHGVIVCTTVLERGVTVANAQIAVFHADHRVFDEAGLIQMAGRAGRTFEYPEGDVLFLLNERSRLCEQCRKEIEEANKCAV